MRPKMIELHIEELVLYGFSHADRYGIAEAFEDELAQLLREQRDVPHLFEKSSEIDSLKGGSFEMTERMKPEAVGISAAKAIHARLNNKK